MTPTRYSARCHCGAVRFDFPSPPLTTAVRCNCSICVRKNTLMSTEYLMLDSLEGQGALTLYQFGDREVKHWFCAKCGVAPFHESGDRPGRYRVNLGCVEGLDPNDLPVTVVNGKAF